MSDVKFPYSKPFIQEEDIQAVLQVLRSDFLTQGEKSKEFERALAEYCGVRFAVVFSSGTASLHGAYACCGLGPQDEVVMSPMTFVATSNPLLYLGAKVVFVDIEKDTGNIDVDLIEKAITSKTKAIVVVDYAGHSVDMGSNMENSPKLPSCSD